MTMTYVGFDTRTGQILSVHHGRGDAKEAERSAREHAKVGEEHVGMMAVSTEAMKEGKHYKVDVGRKVLVGLEATEGGSGFSFGRTGRVGRG